MSSAADDAGPFKVFQFVKRRPGISPAEFRDRWDERHAQFLAEHPELRDRMRRVEHHHRLAGDDDRERAEVEVADAGFDGVAVVWFDSLADLRDVGEDPAFAELAAADLSSGPSGYRDPTVATVVTRRPDVIVGPAGGSPDAGMSLICILRHHPSLGLDEFHDHWLHHHGPLFQNIPELHDPLLGYEQNHGLPLEGAEFDGVTQQWFASLDAWVESVGVAAHRDVVDPDIRTFLDFDAIYFVNAGPPTVLCG